MQKKDSVDDMLRPDQKLVVKILADYGKSNGRTIKFVIPNLRTNNNASLAIRDFEKASVLNEHFCKNSNLEDSNIQLPTFENRTKCCCLASPKL